MAPFVDEAMGLRGLAPVGCPVVAIGVYDCSSLSTQGTLVLLGQQWVEMSVTDLLAYLSQDDQASHSSSGTVTGKAFSYDRYGSVGPLPARLELPWLEPGTMVRTEVGLAQGKAGSVLVTLLLMPEDYDADPAMFERLLQTVMEALEPLAKRGVTEKEHES
jgi:hypothetical protein